ncbi:hypothetical protein BKA63DRAFT_542093 [Paraphoma chrysanthemicola]|nr:hypothetical protein BKA63DRAFT_542093 [Paraphoma chrysanthemicola]
MRFSSLSILAALGASCAALPANLTNFLLVTTSSLDPSCNSSELKAVSATSLFDPFNQPALLLRLIGPGYNSLPNFTLTSGTLSTYAQAPFGGGTKLYNSTVVEAGKELQFLASAQPAGNLALDAGYLLTVDGEKEGWTICDGPLENEVLSWKGTADGCQATYLHAVTKAPY